jgi:hypothetical protein
MFGIIRSSRMRFDALPRESLERVDAVLGLTTSKPLLDEELAEGLANPLVVIDYHDASSHESVLRDSSAGLRCDPSLVFLVAPRPRRSDRRDKLE